MLSRHKAKEMKRRASRAVCFPCAFQSYFIYLEGAHVFDVSIFGGVEHFRATSEMRRPPG
jgi:hypothetical protein